ncbi:aquaporin-8 [Xenopus tropicalis]|uniref:Aquaporin-8 n=1 Tax=Xenopus tropicalis TaxID=8364 RepID=A0A6I8QBU7_XENTR|nr:aquaporin-8 [Xenopus tropicalis]|eukprot:XP_002937066.2 PREDICTED: aquaporin-8-like [Xenopus tropicalis]
MAKYVCETELQNMGSESREGLAPLEKEEPSVLEKYIQPCVAELLGSTLFIFLGCLSVLVNPHNAGPLLPALVHGFTLASVISVLGNVSGGHFNPAVTLSVVICGGLTPILLVPYWVCQLSGGMLGALLAKGLADHGSFINHTGAACMLGSGDLVARAVGVEIVLSFLLIFTVVMGAVGELSKTPLAPYSIAFVLTAAILSGGSISGSCLNPARALGPAVVANYWDYHWVYWVGPLAGALLVSLLYRFILAGRSHRLFLK